MTASVPDEHPSPHRDRVGAVRLFAALAAGPAAWIVQLVAGYGVSSLACFPRDAPFLQSPPPGSPHETAALMVLTLICLLIAMGGASASLQHWRRTRNEKPGDLPYALERGEGRTRFLSACGVLMGLGFTIAILFDVAPIVATPACWSIAT